MREGRGRPDQSPVGLQESREMGSAVLCGECAKEEAGVWDGRFWVDP